ncbi:hypothetical protein [Streptacidiphilus cavernicola]|uniref:Peptidase S53 domain-containing protein n=1 Tax=Streptacidiphilus cavernicola TaxID=3342716 RepID=A0ABV6VSW1_9ACTN
MRTGRGIRPGTVATVLAVAAALLTAPLAHADAAPAPKGVRLTAAAISKLSQRYQNRIDGTPGQVAYEEGASVAPAMPTGPAGTGLGATAGKASGAASGSSSAAASGTSAFQQTGAWETARGFAETAALGGTGDWVGVFSGGTVARYDAEGNQVWDRAAGSFYADWQVKPVNAFQPWPYTPNLYQGYDPYQMSVTGRHAYVTGDVNGDGVDDIAVAYAVADSPFRPFTSPGSTLNNGTFVTVLDGRTGKTDWSKLVPGYVGNMLVQDGRLIVADATGPSWSVDPVAEQGDSRSSLTAYSFTRAAAGKLTAKTDWTYSTHAPWANWGDLEPLAHGEIAASWSDTPMGLGSPRPADGRVLVLNGADGKVAVDAETPGYPRMLAQDPTGDRVLVVEQRDPYDVVGWDLTSIDAHSGARKVITSREGTVPEAFAVAPSAHGHQARYAVAELGINADLSDGQSTVSGLDGKGGTLWSHTTASTVGGANAPTLALAFDTHGGGQVIASVSDPAQDTAAAPQAPEHTQLIAFDSGSGKTDWRQQGAVSGDQLTQYRGKLLTVGYDDTAYAVDPAKGGSRAMPLAGDPFAVVNTDVNGDGVKDMIVAGQSRGVFAVDGRTLKQATPTVLWHSTVDASVADLTLVPVGSGKAAGEVAAATGDGFSVLDVRTGAVRTTVHLPGYTDKLTVVGDGHGGSEIVVPGGGGLTAYTPDGAERWTYRPKGTAGKSLVFSTVATDASGHLLLEYSGTKDAPDSTTADPAPTVVSLDSATGVQVWAETPADPGAAAIAPTNSVFVSPYLPGADGHGVAVAFSGRQSSGEHLVQILDERTGAVLSTHESSNAYSFLGFTASKQIGMVELLTFDQMIYPADGSAPYEFRSFLGAQSALFVKTAGGTESFVGAGTGFWDYTLPFGNTGGGINSVASAGALGASVIQPARLGDGPGDDMIGVDTDWTDLDVSLQTVGSGSYQPDSYLHGLTTYKITDAAAAGTAPAVQPAAPRASGVSRNSASPLQGSEMRIGTATTPIRIQASHPTAHPEATGAAADGETAPGYTPQQIQARLGLKGDGTGQTVAIVDAFDYPTAEADLNHFAAHFGLPPTCDTAGAGTDCFDFQVTYADGAQPAGDTGWNEEAALDIEWAHSVAPHAKIVLVEAADSGMAALERADDAAAARHPAAVSNSWGESEFSEESFYDGHCKLADSVCVQSTGDNGYPSGYSATNPYVLAIGGTSLQLDAAGNTLGETAWSSTGGGLSYFEPRPAYQDGVQSSPLRATPDVSFVADPRTGVPVYITFATVSGTRSLWLEVGGTSLAAPIWSAIISSADQLRAAAGKPHLASAGPQGDTAHADVYALGGGFLRDVTSGSNGACGAECTAGPGYDTVTGLGSPTAGVDAALAALK